MRYYDAMNTVTNTQTYASRITRTRFNPIRNLRPDTLSRAIEEFEAGRLGMAARIFESILLRDDTICGLNLKRKKSIARLESEIVLEEKSSRANKHKKILTDFYKSLEVSSLQDGNQRGGLRMLISQMMDSVPMKYAVHKISFSEKNGNIVGHFQQFPLWLFENTSGKLRKLEHEGQITEGTPLNSDEWLVTCGDGLMIASSVAHLFKELPLKDWLIYCERNGMPGIKAKTDAFPNSPQWEAAREAVAEFGAEFHAVLSEGTDIEAIDVSTRGQLPYPAIIERMDRMLCSLWRGSDLSTMSGENKIGASSQWYESTLIEEADAAAICDTLNRNVDTQVIRLVLGDEKPLAKFRLKLPDYEEHKCELEIIERLAALGLKPDLTELSQRFAVPMQAEPQKDEQPTEGNPPPQNENPEGEKNPEEQTENNQQNEIR